jgi:protein-tyrosine-phosphatase/DNA-binding transcriptional ArsR family regulator
MEINDAATALAALGQPTRLELLRVLLNAGPSGLAAGEVADRLGVPSSTMSFHLRALDQSGLIAATRQGNKLIYAAKIDRLRALFAFISETCCGGEPRLCGDLGRIGSQFGRKSANQGKRLMFNVLFLCTRNSARSIMAEAILNKLAPGKFTAYSAGSDPAPEGPIPEVLSQLKALGHDVSGLHSKGWEEYASPSSPKMDFVITLCDVLAGQVCPDFGRTTVTAAWPMPDPAKFTGSSVERATMLNDLYAGLRRRLDIFSNLPVTSLDRMALKARVDELADPHAAALR